MNINVDKVKSQVSRLLACLANTRRRIGTRVPTGYRTPGRDVDKGWISDEFDAPLPNKILNMFGAMKRLGRETGDLLEPAEDVNTWEVTASTNKSP